MKLIDGYISFGGFALVLALLSLLMTGCASETDKSFEEAEKLYAQENYDGAIAKYNEALKASSKDSVKERALYLIGWTYYHKLKNYEQALSTFQELIGQFPKNDYLEEAMFKTAYCLGQVGQADEALKQYKVLVNRFPESQSEYFTLAYFNQGATYNRQQNYGAARENYELSLKSTQDLNRQAEIQLRIGWIYQKEENYQSAITTFESAIATSGNAIATFELETKENLKSNEIAKAKLNLANAKEGIADVYFAMERWKDAIDEYKSVHDEHSEKYALSKSSYRIGKAYYKLSTKSTETGRKNETPESSDNLDIQAIRAERENPNNFNKALDWYEKTLKDFPGSFDWAIQQDLSEILKVSYKEQNYDHAEFALKKLSDDLYKEDPAIIFVEIDLYLIGYENHKQQNYESALQAFTALVDVFPESKYVATATYYIGETNYHLKEYKTSRKFLEKFLTFSDSGSYLKGESRRLIAQSYLDQKDYHQAYLNFDKLTTEEFRSNDDLWAEAMYKAAYCLKQIKENDEALGRYLEFMTRFPNSKDITDAYFDLGSLYNNENNYELARFNYNRALQSPDSTKHSKAKIQLEIGYTHYNQGNFEKASNVFNLLLKEYSESKQALRARLMIAHIHRREKRMDEAINEYESIIKNRGKGESISISYTLGTGLRLWVNPIALSYAEIGKAFYGKEDFERAFNSYARITKKPGGEESDFRKDPLAPLALYDAMVALCKLGRKDELATFATTYINAFGDISELSGNELILSAEAQLQFAHVLRKELKDYHKASAEYAKLQDYPPKQHLRLEIIKLRGKYYEGQCYEKVSTSDKSIGAYQAAIRLYDSIFGPFIDNPNIDVPNLDKKVANFCIQTARYYAGNSCFAVNQFEKAIVEFEEFLKTADPESEKAKTARDKIEKARRKLKGKTDSPKNSANTSSNTNSPERSQTKKPLTAQEIAEIASDSTVFIEMEGILEYESGKRIESRIGSGSGFYVGHGQIVTNYHVIKTEPLYFPWNIKDDSKDEVISIHPLERGSARLVGTDRKYAIVGYTAVDPDQDLAILKVRAFGVKLLSLGNSDKINQGDPVYPIGNPLGLVNVVSDGQISSIQWVESIRSFLMNRSKLVSDVQQNDTPHKLLMMTAPISGGNSGGPVLNEEGKVIGVSVGYTGGGQNLNYAIPVNYLKALLKRTGTTKPLSNLEIVY